MKADESRTVHLQIGDLLTSEPWFLDFRPGADKLFLATEEYQVFTFTFRMDYPTNYNGTILFEFGGVGAFNHITTVYLDDISIMEIGLG